jgi:transcription antitermination factor NusG
VLSVEYRFSLTEPAAEPGKPWYGIQTKPRFEKAACTALENKGFPVYLPLSKERRQWSDRIVEIETPLFPGYVFCRFDPAYRLPIMTTPGVVSIIGAGRHPEPIRDAEIDAVEAVVRSGLRAEPWPYLKEGERVRIMGGSLEGLEGLLVKKKSDFRVVVSVHLLQRSVAVEVDRAWVGPASRLSLTATV